MVEVKNETTGQMENAYLVLGISQCWNQLSLLNSEGMELGFNRIGKLPVDLFDNKNVDFKTDEVLKCFTVGNNNVINTRLFDGDKYSGVKTALHNAMIELSYDWGLDGNYVTDPCGEKDLNYHKDYGFETIPGERDSSLYIPENKKQQLKVDAEQTPIIFEDADTTLDVIEDD